MLDWFPTLILLGFPQLADFYFISLQGNKKSVLVPSIWAVDFEIIGAAVRHEHPLGEHLLIL